jgi:predicted nucleotidyltransferase
VKPISYQSFKEKIINHNIFPVFEKVFRYAREKYDTILHSVIIFGSFGQDTATDKSDLDLVLLFKTDIENIEIKKDILNQLKSLSEKKIINIFAYSLTTFEKLYRWDNSIAHGAMDGKLIYCTEDETEFCEWLDKLQNETPLNVRRYE